MINGKWYVVDVMCSDYDFNKVGLDIYVVIGVGW